MTYMLIHVYTHRRARDHIADVAERKHEGVHSLQHIVVAAADRHCHGARDLIYLHHLYVSCILRWVRRIIAPIYRAPCCKL